MRIYDFKDNSVCRILYASFAIDFLKKFEKFGCYPVPYTLAGHAIRYEGCLINTRNY